jgi:hypothetical protein
MEIAIDTIQSVVIPEAEPDGEVQTVTPQADDTAIEGQLAVEITDLWSNHMRLHSAHRTTAKELRLIRINLAKRLYRMKTLLSRPGRGGQWRSWLRERGIPRSTADRLAGRHAETLGIQNGNGATDAIPEATRDGEGAKLAEHLWPDLRNILNAHASIIDFIGGIARVSGINHQWRTKGLMIFNAAPKPGDGLSDCTCH